MIITYIQARPNGQIVGSGVIQEEVLYTVSPIEDANVIVGLHADPSTNVYYENGSIVSMPPRPSLNHKFDYDNKQWVFDTESAEAKALEQRDKLLAEGPDRINPMWWSSMTEQEQQAWTFYRQALLDITEQPDYPEFIVWPIKP